MGENQVLKGRVEDAQEDEDAGSDWGGEFGGAVHVISRGVGVAVAGGGHGEVLVLGLGKEKNRGLEGWKGVQAAADLSVSLPSYTAVFGYFLTFWRPRGRVSGGESDGGESGTEFQANFGRPAGTF